MKDKPIDSIDRAILQIVHKAFPVTEQPFRDVARSVGIDENECLRRVRRMARRGIVRKIGPVLEPSKVSRTTILAAVYAPPSCVAEIGERIARHANVSHCYERRAQRKKTAPNIWFTVWAETPENADAILEDIEKDIGLTVLRFPQKRRFKIGVSFDIVAAEDSDSEEERTL